MQTDGDVSKPRKRPFTYGKLPRRNLHSTHLLLSDFVSDDDDKDASQDIQQTRKVTKPSTTVPPQLGDDVLNIDRFYDELSESPDPKAQPSTSISRRSPGIKRPTPFAKGAPREKKRKLHIEKQTIGTRRSYEVDGGYKHFGKAGSPRSYLTKLQVSDQGSRNTLSHQPMAKAGLTKNSQNIVDWKPRVSSTNEEEKHHKPIDQPNPRTGAQSAESEGRIMERQRSGSSGTGSETMGHPATPPRGLGSAYRLGNTPSPSSLGIPNLQISSARSQQSPTPNSRSVSKLSHSKSRAFASPSRPKLKDKLIMQAADVDLPIEDTSTGAPNFQPTGNIELSNDELASPDQGKRFVGNERLLEDALGALPKVQQRGPKVTYAAGHRTLLQESNDTIMETSILADHKITTLGKRSRELPPPENFSQEPQDENEDEESSKTMRSIYELRKAGFNQRLSRLAEVLSDDLQTGVPLSQQRLALVELVKELQSQAFLQQFLTAGYDIRLLDSVGLCTDTIVEFLSSVALLLLAQEFKASILLEPQPREKIISFLAQCLDHDEDFFVVLRSRKVSMSRDLQREILKICECIMALPLWRTISPPRLTCQIVALQGLEYIIRQSREAGSTQELLPKHVVGYLIDLLNSSKPVSLGATPDTARIKTYLSLSILESSAVVYSISDQNSQLLWTNDTIDALATYISSLPRKTEEDKELISLSLKLSLNLSNSSPSVCAAFSRKDVVESILQTVTDHFRLLAADGMELKQSLLLDNLVLALGFLINVCENNEKARKLFREPLGDPYAPIETVIRLFLTRLPDAFEVTSEDETKINVPFGWLAVLLAYLCKDKQIRALSKSRLKNGTIHQLLSAVAEFLLYHRRIAEELRHPDDKVDIKANFTERLQALLDWLRVEEGIS